MVLLSYTLLCPALCHSWFHESTSDLWLTKAPCLLYYQVHLSVNQYFHLRCAGVTALGYFNDTQLLNYTHSAIPPSLDTPPLYCWPVQKHVGEACKTLQGNPIIIQAALAFCWVLHAQNRNVTLNSAALITCAVEGKWTTLATRLSGGSSLRSVKYFMRHSWCSEDHWKPLTKQMLLQGWYTTFTSKATRAVCQMQSPSLACAHSLLFFRSFSPPLLCGLL